LADTEQYVDKAFYWHVQDQSWPHGLLPKLDRHECEELPRFTKLASDRQHTKQVIIMDFLARIARSGFCGLCLAVSMPCLAGVIVTENVSPGATSWPGSPIIQTVSNPAGQVSVGESFNAVGGCTNYCQTFTIGATNYTLQTISLYAGGGTGTGSGTNLTLRLFDLGTQSAPNPSPYTPGSDLFNSGNGLAIAYAPQTVGVLQFGFTEADQVALQSGHMYALELDGTLNSASVTWERTVSDTYSGGAAYRDRSWINGNNAREFALAVYATADGVTNVTNNPWVPTGVVFYAFTKPDNGVNFDGANPAGGLALSDGVLCGTTLNGGTQGAGVAFYMTPDGTNFNVFRNFSGTPDAANPRGEYALAGNGLFSTSLGGGTSGSGAVFAGQTNGTLALLRNFAAVNANRETNSSGAIPSGLIALDVGILYGATTAGGTAANGTVFSLTTNGSTFTVLHDFTGLDSQTGTNADGATPWGGLILAGDKLYGAASAGGAGGSGVVFSVGTNGANFTVIHNFTSMDTLTATNADGAMPLGGLVLSGGTLFGTTFAGGNGGRGTIFSVQTNGLGFTIVHHFSAGDSVTRTNTDGASPGAALIFSSNVLYGAASAGGAGAAGTVFSVSTNGTQFTTVRSFAALASNGTNLDGAFPVAPVLRLGNSLYGTTFSGGPGGVGTVFSIPLSSPPAVITNTVPNPDGSVTLYFLGVPNSTNVIQSTTNFTPPIDWQNVSTNVADANGAWQFTDSRNVTVTRFYRSYQP
jgi:uncharacterized repeat protein (TIGR03803 family)